jgi:muramoyltetrapeptide carboxypeptidase
MNPLKYSDTIGIVSPSSPAAGLFKYRFERGVNQLQSLGFTTKIGANALSILEYSAGTPKERAEDINTFFADKNISAILCTIGGEHSCEVLEYLDFDLIRQNPKIFIGYSDITVLLLSIWTQSHVPTFYGPTLMTEFSEYGGIQDFSRDWFCRTLMQTEPVGKLESSNIIVDELIPWGSADDSVKTKPYREIDPFQFIKEGESEGVLISACIESLPHLKSTKFLPNFENSILFLETASEKPNIPYLAAQLSDLENMGTYNKINGLVFGKKNWPLDDIAKVNSILIGKTAKYSFPIVYGVDFGHISPILTLPIGCAVRLSSSRKSITILDSPFKY